MRFTASTAVGLFALMPCATLSHGFLLVNGTLELPTPSVESDLATGWTLVEPDTDAMGMPVNSATFSSFGGATNHTPGGERALWFRSFEGGLGGDLPLTVNATLFQDVPASPGLEYEISAWFRLEANYSGLDDAAPTQTHLFIEFRDGADGVLGSGTLQVDALHNGDGAWRQHSVAGIAPANTATVRVGARMLNGVLSPANPQSAFVDDFVLVPAPASLALLALGCGVVPRRKRLRTPS